MSKPITFLSIDDPDFAEKFMEAAGLAPGDTVEFLSPQFNRTDGHIVTYIPKTMQEYEALKLLDVNARRRVGMQCWGDENGQEVWLFPAEWYDAIPDGLEVIDIFGEKETFKHGETDNDKRHGALSFGFGYPRPAWGGRHG